jgi:hypothetical protein
MVTLPATIVNAPHCGCGRETNNTGKSVQAYGNPGEAYLDVYNYDGTYPAVSGSVINISGAYQTNP